MRLKMRDNSSQNGTLTPGQVKAINSLLYSANIKQASELSGISRRTIHRWLHDDSFKSELAKARQAVRQDSVETLKQLLCYAVDTLSEILSQGLIDYKIRLKACEIVLHHYFEIAELENINERLCKLENKDNETNS